jgi:hypothetical protein
MVNSVAGTLDSLHCADLAETHQFFGAASGIATQLPPTTPVFPRIVSISANVSIRE